MPRLEDYIRLAPFDLKELVEAANALLKDLPDFQLQERTVRFYISKGLIPPPQGAPKNAKYGLEHLRRIEAIRRWMHAGETLEGARRRMDLGEHGGETTVLESKARGSARDFNKPRGPRESIGKPVLKIPLGSGCYLEVPADRELEHLLQRSLQGIEELIRNLRDST